MSKNIITFLFLGLVFRVLWQAFYTALPNLFPLPVDVLKALIMQSGLIFHHFPYTLFVVITSLCISLVLGFLTAAAIQSFPGLDRAFFPWLFILQAIPIIALGPLLLAIFGYSLIVKALIIAFLCYFPIFLRFNEAMCNVGEERVKALKSLGFSHLQIVFKLRFPAAFPCFFVCIRMSLSWVFSTTILAEFLGTEYGLGFLIEVAVRDLDVALVFAALFVITISSLLLFLLSKLVQIILIPWYYTEKEEIL